MNNQEWKKLNNAELIMYRATEENKWEILEYFAKNNVRIFNAIVNGYMRFGGSSTRDVIYTWKEIINHYAEAEGGTLPQAIDQLIIEAKQRQQNYEDNVQKGIAKSREAIEKNRLKRIFAWEKSEGVPIVLFEVDKMVPKNRDDYFAVFSRYLSENLTISQFCRKYSISPEMGFKEMLERFATENVVYAEQIRLKHDKKQEKDIQAINGLIDAVCYDNAPVSALVEARNLCSLYEWQFQAKNYRGEECCNILREKVINYFHDRITSYDPYSIEPENIQNMLSREELAFIVGQAEFDTMMAGRECAVRAPFLKSVLELGNSNARIINQKVRGKTNDRLEKALAIYDKKFNKIEYFKTQTSVMDTTGKVVEVTPEMVDQAYQFVYSNGLFPSDIIMNRAIRSVACGKIKNEEQTIIDLNMLRQEVVDLTKIKTIEEYLNYIKSFEQ